MNAAWLLNSRVLWTALSLSVVLSMVILLFSPDGLPSLRKREADLRMYKEELLVKATRNQELAQEVKRLAAKDPELFEAMARRHGYARPGETVYSFRDKRKN